MKGASTNKYTISPPTNDRTNILANAINTVILFRKADCLVLIITADKIVKCIR